MNTTALITYAVGVAVGGLIGWYIGRTSRIAEVRPLARAGHACTLRAGCPVPFEDDGAGMSERILTDDELLALAVWLELRLTEAGFEHVTVRAAKDLDSQQALRVEFDIDGSPYITLFGNAWLHEEPQTMLDCVIAMSQRAYEGRQGPGQSPP